MYIYIYIYIYTYIYVYVHYSSTHINSGGVDEERLLVARAIYKWIHEFYSYRTPQLPSGSRSINGPMNSSSYPMNSIFHFAPQLPSGGLAASTCLAIYKQINEIYFLSNAF